jgi:hypothetical protein
MRGPLFFVMVGLVPTIRCGMVPLLMVGTVAGHGD